MTLNQQKILSRIGFTRAEIRLFTPADAHRVINAFNKKKPSGIPNLPKSPPERPLIAPEHKGLQSRNIDGERITLNQYETLVAMGYDGDVIRTWTANRANKEVTKSSRHAPEQPASQGRCHR